jgi:hypothetical protein
MRRGPLVSPLVSCVAVCGAARRSRAIPSGATTLEGAFLGAIIESGISGSPDHERKRFRHPENVGIDPLQKSRHLDGFNGRPL